MTSSGRRVGYDRFWGALLLLTCVLPIRLDGESYPWHLFARAEAPLVKAWLALGAVAGLFAVVVSLLGWRSRWRHLLNFILAVVLLALPMAAPVIWQEFPSANPAVLLLEVSALGWVILVALTAIYAGSGMRVARPEHPAGQALGALGALLLAIFAFLPAEGGELSYALSQLQRLPDFRTQWRELAPFCLVTLAALCGSLNLVRNRAEVFFAKVTRLLLVGGLLLWLALPFLAADDVRLEAHLSTAWGGLRLLAPLFIALDGCSAFLAISITRAND